MIRPVPIQVVSVSSKEDRRPRPNGLNTVELLKAASSSLNMGPAHAMQVGARAYAACLGLHGGSVSAWQGMAPGT